MTAAALDQRGLSQSIQWAVLFPALLLATLGLIQTGIWLHARDVALRSASAAVDEVRGSYGSSEAAADLARRLAVAGGLSDVDVTIEVGAAEARVVVSGDAPLMLELPLGRIAESAAGPVERVTTP